MLFQRLMDPSDDVAAFAKAYNLLCGGAELTAGENTWAAFQQRDILQDKVLLHKQIATGARPPDAVVGRVVALLSNRSVDHAARVCPAIMPF